MRMSIFEIHRMKLGIFLLTWDRREKSLTYSRNFN